MKNLLVVGFIMMAFPFFASTAPKKKSKKGKVVEVHFDDELLIKGKILGPSLFTLYQKKNIEFGKLIEPRKDFLPEMRKSRDDIK